MLRLPSVKLHLTTLNCTSTTKRHKIKKLACISHQNQIPPRMQPWPQQQLWWQLNVQGQPWQWEPRKTSIFFCKIFQAYLQRHGLAGKTDRLTFKKIMHVVKYENLQPDINRIANGDNSPILCSHPISEFLTSSGTSGGERKLMPTIEQELERRSLLYSLLMPVMNQFVIGLDKGKGMYFLFVKFEAKTPGTMSQYIPTLDYYRNGLPLVCTMYASSECYFGVNLNPLCKPEEVCYTLIPNMAYFEFLPVRRNNASGVTNSITMPESLNENEPGELMDLVDVKLGNEYKLVVTTYAAAEAMAASLEVSDSDDLYTPTV